MTSIIVTSSQKQQRKDYVRDYCTQKQIDLFDITLIEKDTSDKTKSIGIEDIKLIQKKIFLKPIKSPMKAVIIEDAELLTMEAQNALLKVLEEPPEQTIIILAGESKETFLPTIISRCHILTLEEESTSIAEKERHELHTFFAELPTYAIGERLKKAETIAKDKEQAIEWLRKAILVLREEMIRSVISNEASVLTQSKESSSITALQSLHMLLKTTNVNPRFAIEHTLLTLQDTTDVV